MGSALDIAGVGWDRNAGAGIAMPLAALQANGAPAIAALRLAGVSAAEVNGNGNGLINAGEDWKFDIALGNDGGATANGLVATLVSNTPGVVVTSGGIAYPPIAANGSAANPGATPFRFSVFDIGCGQSLGFTLHVSSSGASRDIPIVVGTELRLGPPQLFAYGGPPVAIPDGTTVGPGATVAANLAISGISGAVGEVTVRIDGRNACSPNNAANAGIDHSYVGDLVIGLRAPDGTLVQVINRMGGGGNYGQNLCGTLLDDLANGPAIGAAASATAPFSGSFRPDAPLATFLGHPANGTWQLQATDYLPAGTGHINSFSIEVSPQACTTVARGVSIAATSTVSGSFVAGGTVVYTFKITNTGNAVQADNPSDEFVDVLSSLLTVVPAASGASSGTLVFSGNAARWNGSIDAGATVTITIQATVNAGTNGMMVSNQGTVYFDSQHRGTNDTTVFTDDPAVAGTANATAFVVGAAAQGPIGGSLDIDGNGACDALTDGVLVLRYLFGLTGSALTAGAVGPGAKRTSASQIIAYLDGIRATLDIDGNGSVAALGDGLLIMRYMFGMRGETMIAGVVGSGATRSSAAAIESYIQSLMP
jgi:uncharacterized repeat protein (TIGR01451 family)